MLPHHQELVPTRAIDDVPNAEASAWTRLHAEIVLPRLSKWPGHRRLLTGSVGFTYQRRLPAARNGSKSKLAQLRDESRTRLEALRLRAAASQTERGAPTGRYVGEGFGDAWLDTSFSASSERLQLVERFTRIDGR